MTITKEWLTEKIKENPSRVIGRVLLAIYRRQTDREQTGSSTVEHNGVGFSKIDARTGSIGARQFWNRGYLDQWVIDVWNKPAKDGFPRICKYVGQLDEIAQGRSVTI